MNSASLSLSFNISQDVILTLIGKNEVHLSGYYEPNHNSMSGYPDRNEFLDDEDEDEGGESENEEFDDNFDNVLFPEAS